MEEALDLSSDSILNNNNNNNIYYLLHKHYIHQKYCCALNEINIYICVCVYIYIYTHTHTHTHLLVVLPSQTLVPRIPGLMPISSIL